jgi:hypothetical protein
MSNTATKRPYIQLFDDLRAAFASIDRPQMNGLYLLNNNAYWDLTKPEVPILDRVATDMPYGLVEIKGSKFREGRFSPLLLIYGVTQMPSAKNLPINEKDDILEFTVRMFDELHKRGWLLADGPALQSQDQDIEADWLFEADGRIAILSSSRLKYKCLFRYPCCPPID